MSATITQTVTPLSPFEERAEAMLARVFRGLHHVHALKKGGHWTCLIRGDCSTYDSDLLTRIVLGAHEYCLRVEMSNGGPRCLKLLVTNRTREGDWCDRHPTIEQAIAKWEGGAQ